MSSNKKNQKVNLSDDDDVTTTPSAPAVLAIDFQKLYLQERQKAREERRRRHRRQQQEEGGESKDNSIINEEKNIKDNNKHQNNDTLPVTPTRSTPLSPPVPVWNHAHLKLEQQQNNDNDNNNNPLLAAYHRLDTTRHVVCSNNPAAIYYIPNFISTEYQNALSEWLLQLPENDNNKQQHLSMQQQEERAMGCWTTMKYAQRRVALFDNRQQEYQEYSSPSPPLFVTDTTTTTTATTDNHPGESGCSSNNSNSNISSYSRRRGGFPEPLASLARHISNFCAEIMPPACRLQPSSSQRGVVFLDHLEEEFATSTSSSSSTEGIINHILINDYCHQAGGIMPHTDGPAYQPLTAMLSLESSAILHFSPGARHRRPLSTDKDQQEEEQEEEAEEEAKKKNKHNVSVLLEPGSLVIFHQQAYSDYLHSIRGSSRSTTTTTTTAENDDDNNNTVEEVEVVSETCVNAPAGMIVKRGPQRISLTFRVKK